MTDDGRHDAVATAATWYARLRADDADERDRAAFRAWRASDPAHARAWSVIAHVDDGLDSLHTGDRADDRLTTMIAAARGDRATPAVAVTSRWWTPALAAAVLVTLGAAGMLLADRTTPPARQAIVATATGQIRELRLPDGSTMTLDAQSVAVVDAPDEERHLRLDRGRAIFAVARDPAHPFVVAAGPGSVTALGTRFSVEVAPQRLTVALVEGSVRVDLPGGSRTLVPGDVLNWQNGTATVQAGAAAIGTEWRTGTLTFDSLPLADVVAELNRYSPQQIVITDPALARRPFSGVLDRDGGPDALIAALAAYRTARVTDRTDDRIVLAPF